MTSSSRAAAAPRSNVAADRVRELRGWIDDALAGGAGAEGLVLHATQHDEAILRRSPLIDVAEMSFAGGETRFLGVRVVRSEGGRSKLETLPLVV